MSDNGGPFGSQGNYAAAGARGTEWVTTDYCGRTTIKVLQGKVAVNNLATHQTATVTKGHSYTAAALSPAAHFRWTAPEPISNGGEFASISCAPSGLCAAVDNNGDVVTTSNPAGGPSTWKTTNIVSDIGLAGISCPTAQFCVATDSLSGDVLVYRPHRRCERLAGVHPSDPGGPERGHMHLGELLRRSRQRR